MYYLVSLVYYLVSLVYFLALGLPKHWSAAEIGGLPEETQWE